MSRYIHLAKKLRLAKLGRRTRWAPYWTSLKIHGPGKKAHPGRHTVVKRSWRRIKTKA